MKKLGKFTDYTELGMIPKDKAELEKYLSALFTTWQPVDLRKNNVNGTEISDDESLEQIDIAAFRPDGAIEVIARIANITKDAPLNEIDEANATLIARAPILFYLTRWFYGMAVREEVVEKDSVLAQVAEEVLGDILRGKPYYYADPPITVEEPNNEA